MSLGIDLNKKNLYIVDIRFKQKNLNLAQYDNGKDSIFLSLTPYSNLLLDELDLQYDTFHSFISIKDFNKMVLDEYSKIETFFLKYKEYSFLLRDLAMIITYEIYMKVLFNYFEKQKKKYKIIYISDSNFVDNKIISLLSNNENYILKSNCIDKFIYINSKDNYFYKINKFYYKFMFIITSNNLLTKIYNKYINKSKLVLKYDNKYLREIFEKQKVTSLKNKISKKDIHTFCNELENYFVSKSRKDFINCHYIKIITQFKEIILNKNIVLSRKIHPFTFMSSNRDILEIPLYTNNQISKVFMQHGSYLYENIFLKYNEIFPADINFVFNEYTKALFEERGVKKVYCAGSKFFNYNISKKERKYDFLYITYCTSYTYSGIYVVSEINMLSSDGQNIYNRQKEIIELFGNKFKDKTICIKIQPRIFTDNMLYIPFLELSKEFKNITIEFTTPISKIIEKSKYIISDYFSSDFINRELHYKRDIILFKGLPIPLPKDIMKDMDKMFILVDTVNDLKEKIENIENITKNRKRYDDIIEYYSSKKCDTKKVVTEILEKELNGR